MGVVRAAGDAAGDGRPATAARGRVTRRKARRAGWGPCGGMACVSGRGAREATAPRGRGGRKAGITGADRRAAAERGTGDHGMGRGSEEIDVDEVLYRSGSAGSTRHIF